MKGTNLREFEELVLLTITALMDDAYSVAICGEISHLAGRSVEIGAAHAALNCLEEKGHVKSQLGEATKTRGSERNIFYQPTISGMATLVRARSIHDHLGDRIPSLV